MKETYLQHIWRLWRLPLHQMKLSDGRAFRLIFPGMFNKTASGPDFPEARVIIDGIEWMGSVEIHVRSSDWYRHGHDRDTAYNNVILHVVFEHDREVVVNGEQLPTLELKEVIDWKHYRSYLSLLSPGKNLPCAYELTSLDRIYFRSMIDRAILDRMDRKYSIHWRSELEKDPSRLLFRLLCAAFGMKVNAPAFEELAVRTPFNFLKKAGSEERIGIIRTISGLYDIQSAQGVMTYSSLLRSIREDWKGTVSVDSWKRKGHRPASSPVRRTEQLALLVSQLDFSLFELDYNQSDQQEHIHWVFRKANEALRKHGAHMSDLVMHQIMINCFVPFLFIRGKVLGDEQFCVAALEILDSMKPEDNQLVRYWSALGVKCSSALEAQGLLELEHSYCNRKKCLSCSIGIKVLEG